jgi:hypothetical protein
MLQWPDLENLTIKDSRAEINDSRNAVRMQPSAVAHPEEVLDLQMLLSRAIADQVAINGGALGIGAAIGVACVVLKVAAGLVLGAVGGVVVVGQTCGIANTHESSAC